MNVSTLRSPSPAQPAATRTPPAAVRVRSNLKAGVMHYPHNG